MPEWDDPDPAGDLPPTPDKAALQNTSEQMQKYPAALLLKEIEKNKNPFAYAIFRSSVPDT